ncbi:Helicase conserved C-terminal domain-containing protein [Mariprofundus ferrinatatus]|uniref:Helicase conserved C-terminal domain-containing protein n=1 Tax=Mariprofundus ferrinatatus TaxID=1921087 RepID=A0A2K8L2Q5_9PROT|nr:DEAD/DEAH box helicase [Mariprofundus ferrinatatus]ATX81533.1 Helicase conserved C-terminal domain-containing protein [Mariprofundus ferrinatatus]
MAEMPEITEEKIRCWVGEAAAEKGEELFEQGRINDFDLSEDELHVEASVRGEDIAPFQVCVDLSAEDGITSRCNCPMGESCRHVAAVLFAWMEELDGLTEEASIPPAVPFAFGQWLGALESVKEEGSPSSEYQESIKQRLLYILEPDGDQDVRLHFVTARLLKSGGYGKAVAYEAANILQYSAPKYILSIDEKILREVATDRSLASLRGYRIKGEEGLSILKRALSTGRCHWKDKDQPAMKRGDKRAGVWQWKLNRRGDQHLSLHLEDDEVIVPTSPPWYIDFEHHYSGPIETGQPSSVAEILLNMPAVELDCDDDVMARVSEQLPADVPGPVRLIHEQRRVRPLPVIKLYTRKLAQRWGYRTPEACHIAELWFDYDGKKTPCRFDAESIRTIRGERVIDYHRDMEVERRARAAFDMAGLMPLTENRLAELFDFEEHMFTLDDENYWPEWMLYGVPELEAKGFVVNVADNFAFQIEHATGWQLDINQSSSGKAGGLMGQASLTVTLADGEEVDLISAMGRWVGKQPELLSKASLGELKGKDQVPLPLPDGRLLSAPGEMVANILCFMLDVFAGDKIETAQLTAPQLLALEESISNASVPVQISSSAWLKHMSQLANIETIPECGVPDGLKADLRDYQLAGLNWMQFLREMQLAGILADDMGLGKTVQALAHILKEKEEGRLESPALVIAPTSLMHNWRREAAKFTPDLSVLVVHGPTRAQHFEQLTSYDLVLTTYPLLARDFDVLVEQPWHLLILDEAQNIKNPRAKGSQLVRKLNAHHKLCMTGTPMENHLGELWAQFDFLMPGYLHDQRGFSRLFRKPIEIQGDMARQEALNVRIRPFMLRRTKEQVALELPPKTEMIRSIEIEGAQRELYESVRLAMQKRVRDAVASMGLAQSQIVVLDALLKMRQVCCDPRLVAGIGHDDAPPSAKLEMLLDMLPEMIEEGRKVLLFSQFTTMLELIEKEMKKRRIKYVKLTGQTRDREQPIEAFQNGEVPLFLISLKAGGVGLNLTAADTVIHYDPWWNPAAEAQATDRAHRIGQDKAVFVYKLITEGTVEEKILELQERKRQLAEGTVQAREGEQRALWSPQDFDNLFSPLA